MLALFFGIFRLLPGPAAAELRYIPMGRSARPVNYEGVPSEAETFALVVFIHLAIFFFIWLYTKRAGIKPAPDTRIKSIYFNCSHTAAERLATGIFLWCFSSLGTLLFLSRQTCLYTRAPSQLSLIETLAFSGIIIIPVCFLGGLRSVYLYLRFRQEIKNSPADQRHCWMGVLFYIFSLSIFYHTFFSPLCS